MVKGAYRAIRPGNSLLLYRAEYEILGSSFAELLYTQSPGLASMKDQPLSASLLTDWYSMRACEIEERSSLVDHALQLIEIGMKYGVQVSYYGTRALTQGQSPSSY